MNSSQINFHFPVKKNHCKVFLCDLTHLNEGQLSSNVFPLGIGLIAAYLLKSDIGSNFDVELFKYTDDLNHRLSDDLFPRIIGFANYSWTLEISIAVARLVKSIYPSTIIVFGGPNYGLSEDELENFWVNYADCVDFNIVMEGEYAFYLLCKNLLYYDFEVDVLKNKSFGLKNVHFLNSDNKIVKTDLADRLDIDNIPSPYLDTLLMEKFFDGKLIPLTHSTRGCPFKCTFCSEGSDYYSKVKQRTAKVYDEYRYIANKATAVGVFDLMLSDANYGMFKEDSFRSTELAKVQAEFGYPKNVFVSTGKNQKDRVLSVVKKLGGAVQLSASLQTTSDEVLNNIERSNISIDALKSAAQEATDSDVASYSELILGLPGETLSSHINSILDVADAGFSNIRIYQLILLPQTQLNTTKVRKQFGFETKFRPMPRSYGNYSILGEKLVAIEYEEIVVKTNTLSHSEYVSARKIGLLVELVHNGKIFFEVSRLLFYFKLQWSEFLNFLFSKVINNSLPVKLAKVMDNFIDLMLERMYQSKELITTVASGADAQELLARLTTNELASTKSFIILSEFELLNSFVYKSLIDFLATKKTTVSSYVLDHLELYSLKSKSQPFDHSLTHTFTVNLEQQDKSLFLYCISSINNDLFNQISSSGLIVLAHNENQVNEIRRLLNLYGNNDDGFSRIVMRSPIIQGFFRSLVKLPIEIH